MTFKLSQEDHERISGEIERDSFAGVTPVEHPRIICTGGQPGSGKSKLIEMSQDEFPDGNVVVINGDELRHYHPKADKILKQDDKKFAEHTDPDSRGWTKELFDKAIELKLNIIFETTMRESGPLSKTLAALKEAGYQIEAKIVACHERMSTTGIFMRYETQKAEKGSGRFTEMESHDAGYEGMPKTLEHIESNKLADKIEVYDRSSNRLYVNELQNGEWKEKPKAVEIVVAERSRQPTSSEKQQFQSDWQRINKYMEKRLASVREFKLVRTIYEKFNRELGREPEKKTDRANTKESPDRASEKSKGSKPQPERQAEPPQQKSRAERGGAKSETRAEPTKDARRDRSPGKAAAGGGRNQRTISGKDLADSRNTLDRGQLKNTSTRCGLTKSGKEFVQFTRHELGRNAGERQAGLDKSPGLDKIPGMDKSPGGSRSGPGQSGRQMGSGAQERGSGFTGERGFNPGGGSER